jgi:hypothetical protein
MPFDASKMISGLEAAKAAKISAAVRAVDVFGEHLIGDAQQITPVKTGTLQASGTTEPAVLSGSEIGKQVGFNTDYAAAVHEKLESKHDVGEAKFLSKAMAADRSKFGPFVADQVKSATGN